MNLEVIISEIKDLKRQILCNSSYNKVPSIGKFIEIESKIEVLGGYREGVLGVMT